jgi:hypothetical protein
MRCKIKHTLYQPLDENWVCPKCGCGPDVFYIDESPVDSDEGCLLLHDDDAIRCDACESGWSGKAVAKLMQKRDDVVPCPCCKGKGTVPRTAKEKKS